MECDPTRMCELLVGLGEVDLVGINDGGDMASLEVVIRSRKPRPACGACGGSVWSKGYRSVVLVDLPAFGRPVRLSWRKRRWACPAPECGVGLFIEQGPRDCAGAWVVDFPGRPVGDYPGRPPGSSGPRRGQRAGLRLAYGQQGDRPLGRSIARSRHFSVRNS